jgi:hypothetical protein
MRKLPENRSGVPTKDQRENIASKSPPSAAAVNRLPALAPARSSTSFRKGGGHRQHERRKVGSNRNE